MSGRQICDFAHQATILASLAEALDVLNHEAGGPPDCPIAKRARNSLGPVIDVVIEAAWKLVADLERGGKWRSRNEPEK